jgi:hypothetical protein
MKVIEWKIEDLKPAEYNPRKLSDKQFEDIKNSLGKFGFVDPIIVNTNAERKGIIVGGHQRIKVWSSMGNDTAPCVEVDLDFVQEKELNIRLNKNSGEFDFDLLGEFFEKDELVEFGFNAWDLDFDSANNVDYSILDDDDLEGELDSLEGDVKKAIQIEFDSDDYEEAKSLVKFCRENDLYIGALIMEKLNEEKSKH